MQGHQHNKKLSDQFANTAEAQEEICKQGLYCRKNISFKSSHQYFIDILRIDMHYKLINFKA